MVRVGRLPSNGPWSTLSYHSKETARPYNKSPHPLFLFILTTCSFGSCEAYLRHKYINDMKTWIRNLGFPGFSCWLVHNCVFVRYFRLNNSLLMKEHVCIRVQ
jgi:hypothetical protein